MAEALDELAVAVDDPLQVIAQESVLLVMSAQRRTGGR